MTFVTRLKGTISEAELHMLRARNGGIRNKAAKGELDAPSLGFVWRD